MKTIPPFDRLANLYRRQSGGIGDVKFMIPMHNMIPEEDATRLEEYKYSRRSWLEVGGTAATGDRMCN